MKVVILNNLYFPYQKGGAEQFILNQVKELERDNNQVIIISTKALSFQRFKKEGQVYYLNSLYYNLNKFPKILRLFWHLKQLIFPTNLKAIEKILLQEKPDLAISHNLLGLSWQVPKLLKKLGIKHQHILHDIQLLHPSGLIYYGQENIISSSIAKIYQSFTKRFFNSVSDVSSPSQWLANLHQEKGFFLKSKNNLIKIDAKDYPKIVWPKKIEKLIFVGQLEKHKGLEFLLDYIEGKNELQLTIVGDGSLKTKVENSKKITYLGKLNKQDILREMQKHDCLIVPSLCYENIPQVILEAASVRVPTIASNIGGLVELKNILNLRLFTPDNKISLDKIIESDAVSCQPVAQK